MKLDLIKILPEYGILLDFDRILRETIILEVAEFCLQNGARTNKDFLGFAVNKCVQYRFCRGGPSLLKLYHEDLIRLLMKYDVDFSVLFGETTIDYEFLTDLENHGFDKNAFVNYYLVEKLK